MWPFHIQWRPGDLSGAQNLEKVDLSENLIETGNEGAFDLPTIKIYRFE